MYSLRHHAVPSTAGEPLPGLEVWLANCEHGAVDVGEIEVREPSVFAGYLGDPRRTAEAFSPDGFYRTGDIGSWDGDGNLAVIDRKQDILGLQLEARCQPGDNGEGDPRL